MVLFVGFILVLFATYLAWLISASELNFEIAARLRDEIKVLKKELRAMTEAGNL